MGNTILDGISAESREWLRYRYFGEGFTSGEADFRFQTDLDELYASFERFAQMAWLEEPRTSCWDISYCGFGIELQSRAHDCYHDPEEVTEKDLTGYWSDYGIIEAYAPHYTRLVAIASARDKWIELAYAEEDEDKLSVYDARASRADDAYNDELDRACTDVCDAVMHELRECYEYRYSDEAFEEWACEMGEEELSYRLLLLEHSIEQDEREAARIRADLENL